jgi:hypothetical protein
MFVIAGAVRVVVIVRLRLAVIAAVVTVVVVVVVVVRGGAIANQEGIQDGHHEQRRRTTPSLFRIQARWKTASRSMSIASMNRRRTAARHKFLRYARAQNANAARR